MIVWLAILAVLLVLCLGNWVLVLGRLVRPNMPSWVPILPGLFLMVTLFLSPVVEFKSWWWTALFIDGGSIPGLVVAAMFLLRQPKVGRTGKTDKER